MQEIREHQRSAASVLPDRNRLLAHLTELSERDCLRLGTTSRDAAVPVVLGPCLAISIMKSPIGGKEKIYFYEAPQKDEGRGYCDRIVRGL